MEDIRASQWPWVERAIRANLFSTIPGTCIKIVDTAARDELTRWEHDKLFFLLGGSNSENVNYAVARFINRIYERKKKIFGWENDMYCAVR